MTTGVAFVASAIYLTLAVALAVTLLDTGFDRRFIQHTLRRWGKFLLGLVALGAIVQILTFFAG